ncbi:MAG: hypothetical protein J2P38_00735, partial [Candidatus Dormibacteraeota bacterium]|nr:hypothetical protein [Candidatus Dormibacteraeota bacterium]
MPLARVPVVERVVAGQWAVGDAARRSEWLDDLLTRITAVAAESVGAADAAYWRIDAGRATLIGGLRTRLPEDAEAQALRLHAELGSAESLISPASPEDPERQVLAVVWRAGGVRLGICCAYGPGEPDGFNDDDALVLRVISNSCGNVVERQQALERLRWATDDLQESEVRL